MAGDLDGVWKALSDPTRRAILDLLRRGPRTTTVIVEAFPHLTRFGVMKHVEVLRHAGLINTREDGRQRVNSLNAVPIRQIYERWVSRYEEFWADKLLRLEVDSLLGAVHDVVQLPHHDVQAVEAALHARVGRKTFGLGEGTERISNVSEHGTSTIAPAIARIVPESYPYDVNNLADLL